MNKRSKLTVFLCLLLSIIMAAGSMPVQPAKADEPADVWYGDVNDDGSIDAKDVTMLRRQLAGGWNVNLNGEKADLNQDNEINAKDVTMLRRFLAGGWGVVLRERNTDYIEIDTDYDAVTYVSNIGFMSCTSWGTLREYQDGDRGISNKYNTSLIYYPGYDSNISFDMAYEVTPLSKEEYDNALASKDSFMELYNKIIYNDYFNNDIGDIKELKIIEDSEGWLGRVSYKYSDENTIDALCYYRIDYDRIIAVSIQRLTSSKVFHNNVDAILKDICKNAHLHESVLINEQNFPDDAFREYVDIK